MKSQYQCVCRKRFQLRRCAGGISPKLLAVLLGFGLALGGVGYLLLDRYANPGRDDGSQSKATAAEIAAELALLQEEFQTAMQERLGLSRLEARVSDFTRRYPEQTDGHVLLAQIHARMLKWEQAYKSLTRALADKPNEVELNKMAGACAAKLNRLELAERHYLDAVRATGDAADCTVYAALGQIYLAMDNADQADQAFQRALKAPGPGEEPNYMHEARSGLADVAALRNDFEAAHEQIDRAIRLGNADSSADLVAYHIQKARLYMDAGQDDDAVTMLSHTWTAYPDARWRIESARLRARLYEQASELDKAVNHIATVCDYHQRDTGRMDRAVSNFVALLARWQIKAGQTEPASISLHNLQTLAPDHPELPELRKQLKR